MDVFFFHLNLMDVKFIKRYTRNFKYYRKLNILLFFHNVQFGMKFQKVL